MNLGSKTEDIKSMRSLLGGEIPDIEEIFQNACSTVTDREKIFYGNEIFNVTCDNFQAVLRESVEHSKAQNDEL